MAKEKRLIDANAVKDNFCNACSTRKRYKWPIAECRESGPHNKCFKMRLIDEATNIDAVEVVRCKDCKYWHEETGWCDHHSWFIEEDGEPCHPWESNNWKMLMEDDFCSYGERKDNDKYCAERKHGGGCQVHPRTPGDGLFG